MPTLAPTKVTVTAADILEGRVRDRHPCAVALATARAYATGRGPAYDPEVMVFEDSDSRLRIEVGGRSVVAPWAVREFVWAFDDQPRGDDCRLDVRDSDCHPPEPFEFELPPEDDPSWEVQCGNCGGHFDDGELDGEDYCEDCREP